MASRTLNTILSLQDNVSQRLTRVSSNFSNLSRQAQTATLSAQRSLNNLGKGIENTVTKVAKLAAGIGVALGGASIGKMVSLSDEQSNLTARIALMNDGLQTTEELQNKIFEASQRSRGEYTATAQMVAKLGVNAKDAFSSSSQIVDFAENMNKLFKAGGASAEEQSAGMLQLTQALASGKLQGDEFRSITENAPELIGVLAEKLGKTRAEIKQMSTDGALTSDVIISAVIGATDSINSKFGSIPKTWADIWKDIKNTALQAAKPILDNINKIANNINLDTIKTKIMSTMEWIANTIDFQFIIDKIVKLVNFINQHKDIIITIGSMAVAFTIVSKAVRTFTTVINIFKVAWAILNGTILLSPIGWVILGITALVGLFVLLWTKCEGFRKIVISIGQSVITWFGNTIMPIIQKIWTSLQNLRNNVLLPFATWLLKVLAPVFTIIWEYVKNAFNGIGLVIQGALEIFNGIIDFITGVFTGNWGQAWEGVKTIFKGIFDSLKGIAKAPLNFIIDIVNKCIDGINKIDFNIPDWVPVLGGEHVGLNIPHIPALATGSAYTQKGLTLVGEHGPELVTMPSGAKVNTNSQTQKIMSNGKEINFNIKIDTFIGQESFADSIGEHIVSKVKLALNNM